MEPIHFNNENEWHEWLSYNHNKEKEIWLVIQKKKSTIKGIKYNQAVEEAVCFGWIDGRMKRLDDEQFIQRFSPRRKKSNWSLSNKKRAQRMIDEGRMTKAGYAAIEEAKKKGKWDQSYPLKETRTPEDLIDELKKTPQAYKNFNDFPRYAKYMYIRWIDDAKRNETRKRRIMKVVERSKKNLKPGIDL
jgi:uncharacterized protein YdeI (YjbR/CyaY-like superfamily)